MTARPGTSPSHAALWLVLGTGMLLGVWLRAVPLANAFLFGDELHSLAALRLPWSTLAARYDAVGSGLALPLAQKGMVAAFGASLPVIRAIAFVPALLLVPAVARLARLEGDRSAAIVAALVVALAPVFVFYGHFARSYSLAALLCIAVQVVCARRAAPTWRDAMWIAVLGGLAAWAHLTSTLFLLALGAGAFVAIAAAEGWRRVPTHPFAAGFASAALLALALHAPAFDSMMAIVEAKGQAVYYGRFGPFDALCALAGSASGAALAAVAVVLSAVAEGRARGFAAAPLLSAVFVPPLLLWLVSPYGDAYAWARYLLPSAAAGCALIALGCVRLGRWLQAHVPACPVELAGIAFALVLFALGPRGPFAPALGPFANTYLGLFTLPAFTEGVPPAPDWYETVAGASPRLTLVEAPPLPNRSVHYLAALWRWHGQDVRIGTFGALVPGAPPIESKLYVDLSRWKETAPDVDALVVHRRIASEVERYWADVYAAPHEGRGRAFMERHRVYGRDLPAVGPGVLDQLAGLLGPPTHEDDTLVVWRFTEAR